MNLLLFRISRKSAELIKTILWWLAICGLSWWAIAMVIQAFLCPHLTQTEVFLRSLHTFILDFHICNFNYDYVIF